MKNRYERLAALAGSQDNVVTRRQLAAVGFTDKNVGTMVRRKHWLQLQRGIYLLSPGPPTWRQSARAAQWAGGLRLALDAGSSLRWCGVDAATDGVVELTLINRSGGPRPRRAIIRQPSRPLRLRRVDGVIVVCPEDALLNFAATSRDLERVEVAVESALLSRCTTERKIWQTIGRNSRRGVRGVVVLRDVMESRPEGKPARSVLELEVLSLIRRSGLPLPSRNVDVVDGNGERREIDLCYLERKGAIEADSQRFHGTRSQRARDARRQAALEAVGFRFVRVTWHDVFQRPEWVIDQVRELLEGVVAA